jgi:hypothetical protein
MELDVRAADSGMKVHAAAVGLLASLPTAILPSDE